MSNTLYHAKHLFLQRIYAAVKQTVNASPLLVSLFIAFGFSSLAQPNTWVQKSDLGYNDKNVPEPTARSGAVGFSIGSKGYIGTGYDYNNGQMKDFWEYDPATDIWTQKADFGGSARNGAVGFNIGSKGYIGTGNDGNGNTKDFWEYTPGDCPVPYNLMVPKITDTCARLNWSVPDSSIEHIKVSYRKIGDTAWIKDRKKSLENSKWICGLTPNTTYEWKVRNICADDKTGWVHGPNFTTTCSASFLSNAVALNSKFQNNIHVQVMPNPNNGNFTLQMHLTNKAASTKLSLYNNLGKQIWQQNAGMLSGSVNRSITLENKLSAGVFVLVIQHGDAQLIQKVVVAK